MAILSIKAEFGAAGANGIVFLGGAKALNVLGEVTSSPNLPDAWARKLKAFIDCGDGESFPLGGREIVKTGYYVKAKGIVFKQTDHGSKGPAYWELAENVKGIAPIALAATMRKVLAAPTTACDPWVATLIAAMFLSEVVRNPRSFVVNLMLLDLIESKTKYGSAGTKELDFSKLLRFGGAEGGKTATYTHGDTSVTVGGRIGAAGTVRGGKLPMSHLGAMEQYQTTLSAKFEYKKTFGDYAKQSKLNLEAPSEAGAGYHFSNALLEKECTILLRWLLAYFSAHPLAYQTGVRPEERMVKGNWGKPDAMQKVDVPVTVPVVLSGLRDHVRNPAWMDAAADADFKSPVQLLVSQSKAAISTRQSCIQRLV